MLKINEFLPALSLFLNSLELNTGQILEMGYNEFTIVTYKKPSLVLEAVIQWFIKEHNMDLSKYSLSVETFQDDLLEAYYRVNITLILVER